MPQPHIPPDTELHQLNRYQVREQASLWVAKTHHSATGHEVVGHLLDIAAHQANIANRLTLVYARDAFDINHPGNGLGYARREVWDLAVACAHNADLFLREAARRRPRRHPGWDPFIPPTTT